MDPHELQSILRGAQEARRGALDEPTGKRILAGYGIAVPNAVVLAGDGSFAQVEGRLKQPYVLKLISPDVIHKTEMGGVRLNLASTQALEQAAGEIRQRVEAAGARVEGWLVEEMAEPGVEVVVGGLRDPEFGPMVMIGLGGIFVEIFKDVSFRICPVTRGDALQMVDELQSNPLLKGARGKEGVSIDALVETILRVGGEDGVLMHGQPQVAELDINPLIVSRHGAVAVDARFILDQ